MLSTARAVLPAAGVILCNLSRGQMQQGFVATKITAQKLQFGIQQGRSFAREAIRATPKRKTLRETLMAPATDTPFAIGKIAIATGAGVGLGALCFYGLGLSNQVGAIDRAAVYYPIHMVSVSLLLALLGTIAAMIGTGEICRRLPYEPGRINGKHFAWLLHCAVLGGVIAPLTLLGGPIMLRASLYTAGIVGGLSAIAVCAPSDKFLSMGGPLAIGLGLVVVSSIGSVFLPPTSMLGAGLYSIALYGGLGLFSLFMLHDTQRIVKLAENYPNYAMQPYDPINACMSIYLDTLNIFIRMAMILGGGGGRRK